MTTFKKGSRVEIIAQSLGGQFFHEGTAMVVRAARDSTGVAVVAFDGREGLFPRWIDPEAQIAPKAYAADMNRRVAEARKVTT